MTIRFKLAEQLERKQFRDESTKVYGAQKAEYDRVASLYVRLAKERGLKPEDVVSGYTDPASAPAPAAASTSMAPAPPETDIIAGRRARAPGWNSASFAAAFISCSERHRTTP